MVTTDIETLYEEHIKPRSRQDQERLVELIRHPKVDNAQPVDKEAMHPVLRGLLERLSRKEGVPFDEYAREWRARRGQAAPVPDLTPEEWEAARQRIMRHAGAVSVDDPSGLDNEQIDADLAHEYAGGLGEAL